MDNNNGSQNNTTNSTNSTPEPVVNTPVDNTVPVNPESTVQNVVNPVTTPVESNAITPTIQSQQPVSPSIPETTPSVQLPSESNQNTSPVSIPSTDLSTTQTVVSEESVKGQTVVFLIIGLVLLVAALIGGIYIYNQSNQNNNQVVQQSPSPTASPAENLETELNSITVSELDPDFSEVDKEIPNL